jgi:WD40 repeat protein
LALSEIPAQRTRDIYDREKRKETEPERAWNCAALFDLKEGKVLRTVHGHRGVVSSVGVSPDGETLASGGWDKRVLLHRDGVVDELKFGWSVRRVRFSPDGRYLLIAAWTPQNPIGDKKSDLSALMIELGYGENAHIVAPP